MQSAIPDYARQQQMRRAQTAGQPMKPGGGDAAASPGSRGDGLMTADPGHHAEPPRLGSAAVRRRPRWNASVTLPAEASFSDALQAWQQDVERGVYAPKLLGSIAAVRTGRVSPAPAPTQYAGRSKSQLGCQTAQRAASSQKHKAMYTAAAAKTTVQHNGSAGQQRCSSDEVACPAVTPAVFQGSGEDALLALENLVEHHLVCKPHLTLMQLQRAVQGVSGLDSPCQLAAIGVLVRAGYWLAAMQVAYADGLSVLSGVLCEMRAIIELGLHWSNQHVAAAAWRWAPVDTELFMHTFRQSHLALHYQQLRRQLTRLQQLQHADRQRRQRQQQRSPLAACPGPEVRSSSALQAGCHPDLVTAERVLLISIIDSYQAQLAAAAAGGPPAGAVEAPEPTGRCQATAAFVGCYVGLEGAAGTREGAAGTQAGCSKTNKGHPTKLHCSKQHLLHSSSTLHVSSDWRIVLDKSGQDSSDDGSDSSSTSSGSSSSHHRSSTGSSSDSDGNNGSSTSSDDSDRKSAPSGSDASDQQQHPAVGPDAAAPEELTSAAKAADLPASACAAKPAGSRNTYVDSSTPDVQQPAAVNQLREQQAAAENQQQEPPAEHAHQQEPPSNCTEPPADSPVMSTSPTAAHQAQTAMADVTPAATLPEPHQQPLPAGPSQHAGRGQQHVHEQAAEQQQQMLHQQPQLQQQQQLFQASGLGAPPVQSSPLQEQPEGSAAQPLQQQAGPATPAPPAPPASKPCSRPQSHQASRRCSTAQGSRPGSAATQCQTLVAAASGSGSAAVQAGWPPAIGSILALPGARGSRSSDSGNGRSVIDTSVLAVSAAAAGRMRPVSAASKLSRPSSSSNSSRGAGGGALGSELRPRPGSAAAGAGGGGGGGSSRGLAQQQQQWVLLSQRDAQGLPVPAGVDDAGLQRFRAACAQHRQGLQQWAEETAAGAGTTQADGVPDSTMQTAVAVSHPRPEDVTAADKAAAVGVPAATVSTTSSSNVVQSDKGAVGSACGINSPAPAALLAEEQGSRANSCDTSLLPAHSQLVGQASPEVATTAPNKASDDGSSSSSSGSAGKAEQAGAPEDSSPAQQVQAIAPPAGRLSCSLVPPLPLLQAGLITADDHPAFQLQADAPHAKAVAGCSAPGRPKANTAATGNGDVKRAASRRPPKAQQRSRQPLAAPSQVCHVPGPGRPASTSKAPAEDTKELHTSAEQQLQQPPEVSHECVEDAGPPGDVATLGSEEEPLAAAVAGVADLAPGAAATISSNKSTAGMAHSVDVGHIPLPPSASAQLACSAPTPPAQASQEPQHVEEASSFNSSTHIDQPPPVVAATAANHHSAFGDKTVVAAASPLEMASEQTHFGTDSIAAAATGTAPDEGKATAAAESQLLVDLTHTMQQFQQQLQHTALLAQQLLAQQVAGQAAREAGSNSRSSSRPVSAASGRPGSGRVKQHKAEAPIHMPAAGGNAIAATSSSAGPPLATASPLTSQLQGVFEADEPPAAAEVQAYAQYLGMDITQDVDLLYLAEEALLAPVPDGWTVHLDEAQNEYFHNTTTGESTYEHPMDEHYRQLYRQLLSAAPS